MKTIWFCGDKEAPLIKIAEVLGEELIDRDQQVEIIVQSEVEEILGNVLKDAKEKLRVKSLVQREAEQIVKRGVDASTSDRTALADRLGFIGNLLHRNDIFALIVSKDFALQDRKLVKETYGNYIQVNLGSDDSLTDISLNQDVNPKPSARTILEYLVKENLIPEQGQSINVYSKEEEEEIKRRLEDLGYI